MSDTIRSWKSKTKSGIELKNYLFETKEYAEKGGKYEHLTLSKNGVEAKTDRYDRDFLVNSQDKQYKITRLNQLCYNPANLKFGVISLNHYGEGIFSPIYVTFNIKNINPNYLEIIVTSKDFISHSLRYQEGTVYERMAVSVDDFLNIQIVPCSSDRQKTIAEASLCLEKIRKTMEMKIEHLVCAKNYLLNHMFI